VAQSLKIKSELKMQDLLKHSAEINRSLRRRKTAERLKPRRSTDIFAEIQRRYLRPIVRQLGFFQDFVRGFLSH
jgi:hypothetical protein